MRKPLRPLRLKKWCKMNYQASYIKHELQFLKPARTSRGEMQTHSVYYITLNNGNAIGTGESAPLKGLSIDAIDGLEKTIKQFCLQINEGFHPLELDIEKFPSVRFAFECALKGLENSTEHILFDTDFIKGKGIPINGLVWMDSSDEMLKQAFKKVEEGFECIKFKVGALDFDEECRMLETFRKKYSHSKTEIRLDANGAFTTDEALRKLKELSRFDIHSIEQPIKSKQVEMMQEICASSKIPIALDEELIGADVMTEGKILLQFIKPQYLILKPTLLGGFTLSEQWIKYADELNIGWWATSALESNIGLNAIAQWTSSLQTSLPQGLGTGSLYKNNIQSPLKVKAGFVFYENNLKWQSLNELEE